MKSGGWSWQGWQLQGSRYDTILHLGIQFLRTSGPVPPGTVVMQELKSSVNTVPCVGVAMGGRQGEGAWADWDKPQRQGLL